MTRSDELRHKYPVFRYERFEIDKTPAKVTARFHFSIPPDIAFAPEVHFDAVQDGWNSISSESLDNAVFDLGLIEGFSDWKATAAPVIEVLPCGVNADQVQWWHDLLIHGMGEFFYRNDIDFTAMDFVKIVPQQAAPLASYGGILPQRSLLTIGGGRD